MSKPLIRIQGDPEEAKRLVKLMNEALGRNLFFPSPEAGEIQYFLMDFRPSNLEPVAKAYSRELPLADALKRLGERR